MKLKIQSLRFFAFTAICFGLLLGGCKKEATSKLQTGTVTDIDGNIYMTVKIGDQWWMAQNLNATHYRNASPIQFIGADSALWNNDTQGAYSDAAHGKFYNWHAVSHAAGLAPASWHVATEEDWKKLEAHAGLSAEEIEKMNWRGTNQGDKLKKQGIESWVLVSGVWATDEFGFSALGGSCRMFNSLSPAPIGDKYMGFWWSATSQGDNNQAWYRYLDYKKAGIFRYYGPKTYGFSVRCVKD